MEKSRKNYLVPTTEIIDICSQKFMIEIGSGETSPEESDSNINFINDEDDFLPRQKSLWD